MHQINSNESVLLLDETLIEQEQGTKREVVPGTKGPYVMEPDKERPWEYCGPGMSKRIYLYGTVFFDELVGKYRMCTSPVWDPTGVLITAIIKYPVCTFLEQMRSPTPARVLRRMYNGRKFVDNDRGDLTCYAESDDGIHWTKPDLGIFSFDGAYENNIVWDLHGASVFLDREETDPQKRYKAIGFCRRYRNIFLITSADGIHWDDGEHLEPVSIRSNEGLFNVSFDPREKVYRGYSLSR